MISEIYIDTKNEKAYTKKGYQAYLKRCREDAKLSFGRKIHELENFLTSIKAVMDCSVSIKTIELIIEDDENLESGIRAYLAYGIDIPDELSVDITRGRIRIKFPRSCNIRLTDSFKSTIARMESELINIASDNRFDLPKYQIVE